MSINYAYGTGEDRNWIVAETAFNPAHVGKFETIFALGNGYFGVRATTEERYLQETRGWYVAGLFDEFQGEVTELPNLPDWIGVEIILNGERFTLEKGTIHAYNRRLNLKTGELIREVEWESPAGNRTQLSFRRCAALHQYHLAGLNVAITPLNYDADVQLRSGFDGQVTNSGVQHFVEGPMRVFQEQHRYTMLVKTQESRLDVALAAQHRVLLEAKPVAMTETVKNERRRIVLNAACRVNARHTLTFEKLMSMATSRDLEFLPHTPTSDEVMRFALDILERSAAAGYDTLFAASRAAWQTLWDTMDIAIDGQDFDQLAMRFAQFHLIQMTPRHDSRFSIAAKGLSGEGYKGHVFWDTEIFILPFYIYTFPEIARKLLEYRAQTLAGARKKAAENGFRGAMYAWESALTGEETTPKWGAVDVVTGELIRIWCGEIEQHISVDVAYALWHYFQATGDLDFMVKHGFEMLFETAAFWNSRLEYNAAQDCYEINDVIGADEYSDHINNNAYTNYMVQWHLRTAVECAEWLNANHRDVWQRLEDALHLSEQQTGWTEKAEKIVVNIDPHTSIIPQYDGFMAKKAIDITPYQRKIGAIFEAMGWEEINRCQVLKQADVVMLLYLLGDRFSNAVKHANWNFYEPKTLHDSSLSPAIHSIVASDMEARAAAYRYFQRSSRIDLGEDMHSSDHGLHSAAFGGTWQAVVNGFAGLRIRQGQLYLSPRLPEAWNRLRFTLIWHGEPITATIDKQQLVLEKPTGADKLIKINIYDKEYDFREKTLSINLS